MRLQLEQIKAADDERERILKAIKEHYQDKLTTHFQNCLAHMKTLGGNVQAIIEAGLEAFRIAPVCIGRCCSWPCVAQWSSAFVDFASR